MDSGPDDRPEPVMLIIADISGYTRYMTANAKSLTHSQAIITELIKCIIKQIELPMEVAKLEGDAVFFYCRKQDGAHPWPKVKQIIGKNLITFFQIFSDKVNELSRSTTCSCNACTHIEKLRLKVVVHSGEALFHRVFNFTELAGVDVIIVHRLLKNSVKADQYLLLTEAARADVEFPEQIPLHAYREDYDDIGPVKTMVYVPGGVASAPVIKTSFSSRFAESWKLFCKLWFSPFVSQAGKFNHVVSSSYGVTKAGLAVLTALLTPIYLPAGIVFVAFHALQKPGASHSHHDHDHKSDGSCCDGN
jgi:hypothetical protein